jgi:hypothetical protein
MKKPSIIEIFRAAGITEADRGSDKSTALGVSLTDSGVLKLAAYTGELRWSHFSGHECVLAFTSFPH